MAPYPTSRPAYTKTAAMIRTRVLSNWELFQNFNEVSARCGEARNTELQKTYLVVGQIRRRLETVTHVQHTTAAITGVCFRATFGERPILWRERRAYCFTEGRREDDENRNLPPSNGAAGEEQELDDIRGWRTIAF